MSKQITISDIQPISMSFSVGNDGAVNLSVRYARLDETGKVIEGFVGVLSTEITGTIKTKLVEFVQGHLLPWIRTQEGI